MIQTELCEKRTLKNWLLENLDTREKKTVVGFFDQVSITSLIIIVKLLCTQSYHSCLRLWMLCVLFISNVKVYGLSIEILNPLTFSLLVGKAIISKLVTLAS